MQAKGRCIPSSILSWSLASSLGIGISPIASGYREDLSRHIIQSLPNASQFGSIIESESNCCLEYVTAANLLIHSCEKIPLKFREIKSNIFH
jgi:hypothetical protein